MKPSVVTPTYIPKLFFLPAVFTNPDWNGFLFNGSLSHSVSCFFRPVLSNQLLQSASSSFLVSLPFCGAKRIPRIVPAAAPAKIAGNMFLFVMLNIIVIRYSNKKPCHYTPAHRFVSDQNFLGKILVSCHFLRKEYHKLGVERCVNIAFYQISGWPGFYLI